MAETEASKCERVEDGGSTEHEFMGMQRGQGSNRDEPGTLRGMLEACFAVGSERNYENSPFMIFEHLPCCLQLCYDLFF